MIRWSISFLPLLISAIRASDFEFLGFVSSEPFQISDEVKLIVKLDKLSALIFDDYHVHFNKK